MGTLNVPLTGEVAFFGGQWNELKNAEKIPAISPSSEDVIGYIAAAKGEDLQLAVETIEPALAAWAEMSATERTVYMKRYAQRLEEYADDLVELEINDGGLTRRTAERDVQSAINVYSAAAAYATEIKGNTFSAPRSTFAFTEREPYGIVGRIVPFNHPLLFACQAIAATVVAGNAIILKPPEQCSLSALALAELSQGVFPPGILNVITGWGHEVGSALVSHPDIPRIGFTGSVPTGKRILEAAASHIKHVSLELGGKNPLIITGTADTDFASQVAMQGMNFTHAGQSCQSTSRVLIHDSVYDQVVDKLEQKMSALVIGDPHDPATDMGPLAFRAHYDRVMSYVDIGKSEGATLRYGGGRPASFATGFYMEPALFTDVTEDMRIAREEIFGPVVCAMRWSDVKEAVRIANDTPFGLFSRVVAGSNDEGFAIGRQIKAGSSFINTLGNRAPGMPYHGFKESGLGTQHCLEEILSYTQEKVYGMGLTV